MSVGGIHHVTSMTGDPAGTVEFYGSVLGLRLVKRTVNFDDPGTHHLYFGDAVGHPGTTITFFPYPGVGGGAPGTGQVTTTAFRVPADALDYWRERFAERGVAHESPRERFGATVLPFRDPDGLRYELVARETDDDGVEPWDDAVPAEHAIRGFDAVTLTVGERGPTAGVLEAMGYDHEATAGTRHRYRVGDSGPGAVLDVVADPAADAGRMGTGCVHHVAFRTPDDETQADWQATLRDRGLAVTGVKDRQYFRSIYFREPGGVLFEIATEGPGFTSDEDREGLGESLTLPPWLADRRESIEAGLADLAVPADADP